jgi:NAD(P)-dependent dehydrogenase (short-subunit alcohol dehydrogenase family)
MRDTRVGRVAGKVAVVTGAAGGLGAAIARRLADEGARVALTDIDEPAVAAVAATIPGSLALRHDVTDEARWREVLEEVAGRFGAIHVLVNNAGIGSVGTIEQADFAEWKRVHAIDLDSVFLGCKYVLPYLRRAATPERGCAIVNISSVAGIVAGHNVPAYNSAKAAVRHLTKSVALHCARTAPGVRCNSVHPAFVDTPILDDIAVGMPRAEALEKLARQIPLRKVGEPDDVAWGVVYLASDESRFMTGAELVLDGGISAM